MRQSKHVFRAELLTKIYTMNFILLIVIAVFATIYMDKCFSCFQKIFLFIISGNWLRFPVYMSFYVAYCFHRFGDYLTEWHRLINFDNFFPTRCHCKKEIKSTSALKSDNDSSSLKHSGQFPSMQSFKLQSHVCVPTRSWAVGDSISLDFKLELILFAKGEALP